MLARLAFVQCGIAGLDGQGEAQVRERVLVSAIHTRVRRKRRQLAERRPHLRGRSLEQSPASRREQRIAAEHDRRAAGVAHIGDMPGGMTRYVEHVKRDGKTRHLCTIAFRERPCTAGNRFEGRTEHRHIPSARGARCCRRRDRRDDAL